MIKILIKTIEIVDLLAIAVILTYLSCFSPDQILVSDFRELSLFLIGLLVALFALVFPSVLSMLYDINTLKPKKSNYSSIISSVERYSTNLYQNMMASVVVCCCLILFSYIGHGVYVRLLKGFIDAGYYDLILMIFNAFCIFLQGYLLVDILISTKHILDIKLWISGLR